MNLKKMISTALLPMLAVLLWSAVPAEAPITDGYKVGDKAADFSLKNAVDGKMVSLADYKDAKGFILTFTCNTCPYAELYEQRIIDLHNEFAPKGYPVVAINPNDVVKKPGDSLEAMKERAEEKGYPFVYLQDETQEIAHAFGATRTPHMYILDKDLTVLYIGGIDNNPKDADQANEHYIKNAINELLEGKTISQKTTKAIGCTIKWKES